jgi:hydrogenase expression/formation protein HypE
VSIVLLGHGSGGRLSQELVARHFLPYLGNEVLEELLDSAVLGDLALTTDAYVVTPRTFPGGDLGRLAVCGTVNDLVVVGARPLGLTAAFILEEGLPLEEVDMLAASMRLAAGEAGVPIVAGDTKVVPRGACDGCFITTAGVGRLEESFRPSPEKVRPGDSVLVSGTIADHGIAVMACREGIPLEGDLESDVAPLGGLVEALREAGLDVHAMRDPTRGGVVQSLLEIAGAAGVRIALEEDALPVRPTVLAACELLGLDPLYVANEGKALVILPEAQADRALDVLREHPLGRDAARIGMVTDGEASCEMRTAIGARRSLRMASGELLPRIC